jgi:hypothetical protein
MHLTLLVSSLKRYDALSHYSNEYSNLHKLPDPEATFLGAALASQAH